MLTTHHSLFLLIVISYPDASQEHGHVNVPQKYSIDGQLGSWVANIRSKRKQMAKKGEEFELDAPLDNDNTEGNDDDDDEEEDPLMEPIEQGPKKRGRKAGGGRQRLTRDRIVSIDEVYSL